MAAKKTTKSTTTPTIGGDVLVRIEIQGTLPMLMHNGQLSDPDNEWAKEIAKYSKKRNKDTNDRLAMARAEFLGSLWLGPDGPCLPSLALDKMLEDAAKKRKLGKDFKAAVLVEEDAPLIYDGPRDPEALWNDESFRDRRRVVVQRAACWRTRPLFKVWRAAFEVRMFAGSGVRIEDLKDAIETAGLRVGIGDYRPKYGRFVVTKFEPV